MLRPRERSRNASVAIGGEAWQIAGSRNGDRDRRVHALTAVSGLYLGFVAPRAMPHGKRVPLLPDQGAILYEMHSMYSKPDRVRLEWLDVKGRRGIRSR